MDINRAIVEGDKGHQISLCEWPVEGNCKAVIYIVHGLSEYVARYNDVAQYWNEHGIAVYGNDHRGHGESLKKGDQPVHLQEPNGWQLMLDDIGKGLKYVSEKHPGSPVFLLGHSMGALLAGNYFQTRKHNFKGVILSALPEDQGALNRIGLGLAKLQQKMLKPSSLGKLHIALSFGAYNGIFSPTATPFDWLSRDAQLCKKYTDDPLCGAPPSAAFFEQLITGVIATHSEECLKSMDDNTPLLLLAGGNDPVVGKQWGFEKSIARFKKHHQKLTSKVYNGARHEILNETNKEEVYKDVLQFIKGELA